MFGREEGIADTNDKESRFQAKKEQPPPSDTSLEIELLFRDRHLHTLIIRVFSSELPYIVEPLHRNGPRIFFPSSCRSVSNRTSPPLTPFVPQKQHLPLQEPLLSVLTFISLYKSGSDPCVNKQLI